MNPVETAATAVDVLRSQVENRYPGAVYGIPIFDMAPNFCGFGVCYSGGLSIVYVDMTGIEGGQPWAVQISTCLAHQVPDISAMVNWVNDRNRCSTIGRYYFGVNGADGLGAIFYEEQVNSVLIGQALQDNQPGMPLWSLILGICFAVIGAGETDGAASSGGGRSMTPTEDDFIVVFKSTSG